MFDRIERDVELDYSGPDMEKARTFIPKLDPETGLLDLAAAIDYAARETGKKVGVVGYCYGGSMAWLAATRLDPAVAVGYYGGWIAKFAEETPKAPVMLHFGQLDTHIPAEGVDRLKALHPEVEICWYDAGHAFNRDIGPGYQPEAAKLARERTIKFLKKNLVSR
jgi:carboxymethylenebutenolidase